MGFQPLSVLIIWTVVRFSSETVPVWRDLRARTDVNFRNTARPVADVGFPTPAYSLMLHRHLHTSVRGPLTCPSIITLPSIIMDHMEGPIVSKVFR